MSLLKVFIITMGLGLTTGCNQFFSKDQSSSSAATGPSLLYWRGINIMDLASSANTLPGVYNTHYTKPTLAHLQYLKTRGHNLVRLPFLWERIQPTLGGSLDTAYLGYLLQAMRDANTAGLKTIIDMHNYGRFNATEFGNASGPTQAQYADVWQKISAAVQADAAAKASLYAYDIMNEPYSLTALGPSLGATAVSFSTFTSTLEGWASDGSNPGGTTLTQTTRSGEGSALLSASALNGTGHYYAVIFGSTKRGLLSDGPSFNIKVYVPSSVPGTVNAKVIMYTQAFSPVLGTNVSITKGQVTNIQLTPAGSDWTNYYALQVDFAITSDGSAPLNFYIDDVAQGTLSGGTPSPQVWEAYSQSAVTAIRGNTDSSLIMVEGYDYSSAKLWATNHPTKWITDTYNNTIYQAHQYGDDDASGTYASSFATETSNSISQGYASVAARYVARVKVFTDWVTAQGVKGYIGEYGWPNTDSAGNSDGTSWNAVGETLLTHLDSVNMGATMWCTGSWLSPTDNNLNAYQLQTSYLNLSPSTVLEAHPGK